METPVPETTPQSIHPPAEAIAVVGTLVFAAGVSALCDTLFSGFQNLNLGFLGIPVGIGVLKRKTASRAVVLILSGLALLMGLVMAILFALRDLAGWQIESLAGPKTILETGILMTVMGITTYMFVSLRRTDVRRLFESGEVRLSSSRPLLISVTVLTVFVLMVTFAASAEMKRFVDDLYYFHVEIDVRDAKTGERIERVSTRFPASSAPSRHPISENFNQTQMETLIDDEGSLTVVSGMAAQPLAFKFGADGYETQTVTIDDDSEDHIRIELQPLNEGEANSEEGD